ncbi:isoprenylcysteine carboxyl methyltransferase [Pseudovibrio japonicus]|uniref:Isoprenylcysteine carboxyl methyltransferase n=1 Tax=Pseudovibrio japonicus TaxID=366534 RepID=A0ABQ3E876_9HYPH|nr:isoprenylcysteine carboxylmethyltransferase family protein [Pseudovibrio japonicus]GHB28097.1 isoprenylcysteine carboxyl methyltransferase [Pseudovibrio japonicus]
MERELYLRLTINSAVLAIFVALAIMPPIAIAGSSLSWPRGWIIVALVYFSQLGIGLWLARINPWLFKQQTTFPPSSLGENKRATGIIFGVVFVYFLLAALDAHVWQVLPESEEVTAIVRGLFLFLCGIGLIVWSFSRSPFANPTPQIEIGETQIVENCGPYALVRHPMYLGLMFCIAGLSMILGSILFAILAVPLIILGFLPLMKSEEQTLTDRCDGYATYADKVRCRLFPWIY